MRTKPKRNSLTRVGENRCVSATLKKRPDRNVEGKSKSVALMLLAKRAAERGLQAAGAEGQAGFGVGEERSGRKFVLAAAEFAVPVGGELVVGVFAGPADDEGADLS